MELIADLAAGGAEGTAQTDFGATFQHGGGYGVGDANAGDGQEHLVEAASTPRTPADCASGRGCDTPPPTVAATATNRG